MICNNDENKSKIKTEAKHFFSFTKLKLPIQAKITNATRTETEMFSEDTRDLPLFAVVITTTSRSCISGCRMAGFGSGASGSSHHGSRCLLCPRDLAEGLEGQRVRASVHQLLVPLAVLVVCPGNLAVEIIEVPDSVSFTASYEGAFSNINDNWPEEVNFLEPMPSY